MRSGALSHELKIGRRMSITITVRQLEALIRISEALARMRMSNVATGRDVDEAIRLFVVSTYSAAVSGSVPGIEGMTTGEEMESLNRIERQIKRRFLVGSQVTERTIVDDLVKQNHSEKMVYKVIHTMIRRGELQHRLQRKLLIRLK
ncbi:hypothetical protein ACOME3_008590 [Neoechinorhynchus agilis]